MAQYINMPIDVVENIFNGNPNSVLVLAYLYSASHGNNVFEVKLHEISSKTGLSMKSTRTLIDFLCKKNVIKKDRAWNAIQITLLYGIYVCDIEDIQSASNRQAIGKQDDGISACNTECYGICNDKQTTPSRQATGKQPTSTNISTTPQHTDNQHVTPPRDDASGNLSSLYISSLEGNNPIEDKNNIYPIEEKNKKENTKEKEEKEFEEIWDMYQRKDNKQNAFRSWMKLTKAEKEKCKQHIPAFVIAHPDKKYRPMLATYINQKRFNDEEIITGNGERNGNTNFPGYGERAGNSSQEGLASATRAIEILSQLDYDFEF